MTDNDELPGLEAEAPGSTSEAVSRAFGVANRERLLDEYFGTTSHLNAANAWQHVYRLLLWIDRTTGLAHCYESDKCQPGRPWYARSLRFHDWFASELDVPPGELGDHIDWLFSRASADLAAASAAAKHSTRALEQRAPYADRGFPEPGEDPELVAIILEVLAQWLTAPPSDDVLQSLTERIQAHVTKENKRKNLVGEGFEDTLVAVLQRVPKIGEGYHVHARPNLHSLPGFHPPLAHQKPRQVDLALVRKQDQRRILVTAKWSVRSDREEQFPADFRDYSRLEALGQDFDYVLVTNEFDAARLVAACDVRRENAPLFNNVVHVNTVGPVEVYGPKPTRSARRLAERVTYGRLESLGSWLVSLQNAL